MNLEDDQHSHSKVFGIIFIKFKTGFIFPIYPVNDLQYSTTEISEKLIHRRLMNISPTTINEI